MREIKYINEKEFAEKAVEGKRCVNCIYYEGYINCDANHNTEVMNEECEDFQIAYDIKK